MSISSRPVREKKNTHWNLDHIQLQMLTLQRNESRKSKISNNQNQHYGKLLSTFITKINQEYLQSIRKKDSQSGFSEDQVNQNNREKGTNIFCESEKKKYAKKGQIQSKKQLKQESSKRKYQYKRVGQTGTSNVVQNKGEEKRKVRNTEMNENEWYRLYLINKMPPEGKNKSSKRAFYHVSIAYRIHFDHSKEKSLQEIDPTYYAKKLKVESVSKMQEGE